MPAEKNNKMKNDIELRCPCSFKSKLKIVDNGYTCTQITCPHNNEVRAFPATNGVPILISESQTDTVCSVELGKTYVERPLKELNSLKKILVGESKVTIENCNSFVDLVSKAANNPRVLVIGGAEKGSGASKLWESENIKVTSIDIYASNIVDMVCDAHYLPLADDSFDGVWIQAVLEHVVEPTKVVSEIYRVLKSDGLVYAETPFMQQVHEGAYDFTRYTVLGHRYLFKNFEMIKIGGNGAPDTVLVWSFRYFIWSLTRSRKFARMVGLLFGLLLRPFVFLMSNKSMFDASSGVFFLGKKMKSGAPITHKELVCLYKGQYGSK